ncbi:MEDS domain-containing protein [Streptomyces sp. NBC_01304]|uniref:MEDS domain-containing protein n=1 Tax=Streptomyces sp. NBC_01304 TaxID=2903818 RepID=UPI002E13FF20|nr:MEDS domain-containing protein [Streptomyces sp. NBC_01304]
MSSSSAAGTLSVTRVTAGDHACLGFDDDEARWEIRATYADIGLARGERVMFFTDPATTAAVAAEQLAACGLPAEEAIAAGRLVVINEVPGYDPESGFDPVARAQTWVEVTNSARREGFSGVRALGDMGWAADPGVDHDLLVDYEAGLTPLFADIGFTAICEYDRRAFDDALIDRMCVAHPKRVLHRLGALDISRTDDGLRLAGDADLATRDAFDTALHAVLRVPGAATVLDLTELCFLDAHSAGLLVRLAVGLPEARQVEVRCRPLQAKVLRLCGATQVPQLVLGEG